MREKNPMTILNDLVDSGIVVFINDNKYECKCGSVFHRYSVNNHVKSKRHKAMLADTSDRALISEGGISEECKICYTEKTEFFTCGTCKNIHCRSCNESMVKVGIYRCPFCRTYFENHTARKANPNNVLMNDVLRTHDAMGSLFRLAMDTGGVTSGVRRNITTMIDFLTDQIMPDVLP